jgi:sporulation protein YlmC with PRC-barrel domain
MMTAEYPSDALRVVRLELGKPVRCSDDELGTLADVVIDPTTKRITHLVVDPSHEDFAGARLVPVDLAKAGDDDSTGISLSCTVAEAGQLPDVHEFAYLRLGEFPVDDPDWDVGVQDVLATPYYESTGLGYAGELPANVGVTYDRVPKGEVEIRRSSAVFSGDQHHLGHVDGFVVEEDHVTHVVLERGHLWGRREVTIPIGAVAKVENDAVTLSLSKDEVGDLPAVRVHRWFG